MEQPDLWFPRGWNEKTDPLHWGSPLGLWDIVKDDLERESVDFLLMEA